MPAGLVKFDSFLFPAKFLYKTIGLQAYDTPSGKRQSYLFDLIFLVSIVNLNFVLITESIYVVLALKNNNNFVEATMNLSYIGFVFVGDLKIWSVWRQKSKLTQLMLALRDLYPQDAQMQTGYKTQRYLLYYNWISFGFVLVHELLIWTYNLFSIVSYYIYDYWLQQREMEMALPYYCWMPWDWRGHWSYYLLYASQNLAGHTCMSGQLASDLLLCAAAMQVIMHYQYLAKRIAAHSEVESVANVSQETPREPFLNYVIGYHQKILHLSASMNDVFGVSLLVNFISSSFIMCFLGFQITIGVKMDTLVMLFLFLFCSLVQIFMICNYGHTLMLESENIGHAIYKHNWYDADVRYKKMLILIMKRAQKPAILKATTFLNVSLGTMTDLLQLSYKFFALIRTMYSK